MLSALQEMTVNNLQVFDNIKSTATEKWQGLQPRERVLIVVAPIILIIAVIASVFYSAHKNMEKQIAETEEYRKALNYIIDNQAIYQQNQAQKEAMNKRLLEADTKIVSKLSSMASALGFDVNVTPKDSRKTSDDSGAEEQEIEITLKNVDYAKCVEYLVQIHKLDTPLYMRRINMSRTSNNNGPETKMSVSITLMSYRMKEQNGT